MKFCISALLFAISATTTLAQSYDVEFFYTETYGECQWDNIVVKSGKANNHGGVCAYVNQTKRVYTCPAPDPYCWTTSQSCKRGTGTPGDNQILCSKSGNDWCCAGDETCTTVPNQINICISNFTSPLSGVDIATANQTEQKVLGVSNVTATVQTANPTPYSTLTVGTPTASSSSTSSASTVVVSNSGVSPATQSAVNTPAKTAPSGLSGGAIAGIVIGAIAGVALIGAAFFFLGRRKFRGADKHPPQSELAGSSEKGLSPNSSTNGAYAPNHPYYTGQTTSELENKSSEKVEMPTSGNGRVAEFPAHEARVNPQELQG